MAYDVGLSHPDQFAGVIPINGNPKTFPTRYWSNGQYLPFYVVEGERNFGNPKANRTLFKDWVGNHYPAIYVEYKGRGSEWYSAEIESIFDWMSRKKRVHPFKEMGVLPYRRRQRRGVQDQPPRRQQVLLAKHQRHP